MVYEAEIINDCIKIFNSNKEEYFVNLDIVDKIDDYYDNYEDIINGTLNEFIKFIKEKIEENNRSYDYIELKELFYSDEFKERLDNLRDLSNLEYYLYITNKINNKKIKLLENKINYLLFSFVALTILNLFNI